MGGTTVENYDPDKELWARAIHDPSAFDELCEKHSVLVRGELRRLRPSLTREDLHDLEQLVRIELFKSLPNFRGEALLSTWLVGITKNVFHNWFRKPQAHYDTIAISEDLDSSTTHTSTPPQEKPIIDAIVLRDALKKLTECEQQVIQLRYNAQLTDMEIECRLNTPLGTVKSRISRALKKLRCDDILREAFLFEEGTDIE